MTVSSNENMPPATMEINGQLAVWSDEHNGYVATPDEVEGYRPRESTVNDNEHRKAPKRFSTKFMIAMGCLAVAGPAAAHVGTEFAAIQVNNYMESRVSGGEGVQMRPLDYLIDLGSHIGDAVTGGGK